MENEEFPGLETSTWKNQRGRELSAQREDLEGLVNDEYQFYLSHLINCFHIID